MKITYVFGPPKSGKTANRDGLAAAFGCDVIADGCTPIEGEHVLMLGNTPLLRHMPPGDHTVRILTIEEAMQIATSWARRFVPPRVGERVVHRKNGLTGIVVEKDAKDLEINGHAGRVAVQWDQGSRGLPRIDDVDTPAQQMARKTAWGRT